MNNFITANKYLLLDFGNTCLKAAIYNKKSNKISKYLIVKSSEDFEEIIVKGKFKQYDKIVFISSTSKQKTSELLKSINLICKNKPIQQISKNNFIGDIDLSNVDSKVVIGDDILLCAYYLIKQYKTNALFCLGTVYFCVITNGNKIVSVQLVPNITTGLKTISATTSIPQNLIPEKYDKEIGLNTPDAFASGAKTMLDGYIQLIAKKYNLDPTQIIISGGDCDRYKSLAKKYNFIKYGSLVALAYIIKNKNL